MIVDKKYICKVSGVNVSNTLVCSDYTLRAKYSEQAQDIAFDLFLNQHGVCSKIEYSMDVVEISKSDYRLLSDFYSKIFLSISESMQKNSYLDFLKLYEAFGGYDFNQTNKETSFEVTFQGFCFRVVFKDGSSRVDLSVLTYKSSDNKFFIIEANWSKVFIG